LLIASLADLYTNFPLTLFNLSAQIVQFELKSKRETNILKMHYKNKFTIFVYSLLISSFFQPAFSKKSYSLQRQEDSDLNTTHGRYILGWIYIFLFIPPLFLTFRELWLDPTTPVLVAILWRRVKELVSYSGVVESNADGDEFVQQLILESKLRRRKLLEKEEEEAIAKAEEEEAELEKERRTEGKSQSKQSVFSSNSSLREKYFSRNGLFDLLRKRSKAATSEAENTANKARQVSHLKSTKTVILPK
jgi:hypothetical protein